jgi:hypothetical protein
MTLAMMSSTYIQSQEPRASTPDRGLEREVVRKLESADPATVAWGAYEAGAYHLTQTIPALQRIVEEPPAQVDRQRRALLDVVLDALLQLRARLPASLLVRSAVEHPVQSFALLANAKDREPVLRTLLSQTTGFRWFAAANMLLADRAPSLATHLLQTLHLRLTIWVLDSEHGGGMGRGNASGASISDGIGQNPRGYPPHAEYRFEMAPSPGFLVLTTGPRSVFYSRSIITTFQYGTSEVGAVGPTDDDRIAYMRAMIGSGAPSAVRAENIASVRWSTAESLLQRVQELRRDIELRHQFMEESLRSAYGLSVDAATAQRHVEVRLVDERKDRSVALPEPSK